MEVTVEDKLIHTNINPKLGVQKWISGYEINKILCSSLRIRQHVGAVWIIAWQAACQPGNDLSPRRPK
jgi:hypothetical protein